jgi:hypothetical protein
VIVEVIVVMVMIFVIVTGAVAWRHRYWVEGRGYPGIHREPVPSAYPHAWGALIGDSEEDSVQLVHTITRKIIEPDAK